ncbi:MAG: SDR family NAD(P)-dependent oxidoreductase [Gammaproteobacteria bacterium]|nr:SDR family NAD(P)-dependent oxidoreductase [Gammaproteobacteria bacterium]MDH3370876.1 SDR family NAD(P)-dependent oxidoreductase [Gammaproteobacteria bacterium]MDH3405721.1 SDR family NAD(P)-dependent oxidoreductase [Gammaproteobacteria bacterium]MDH3563768.1 SDR family NAD(P)-dependent oxidoreductase [Gammaproteobacteria bacterium]MDH5486998.1 SDR family NAD(P)-dependent oxidoreductase [Gammaproteobacteria bacterium]
MSQLKDKVVIITGAVGNLGRAVVECVRAKGGKTVLVDRSNDRLQKFFGDLKGNDQHWLASGIDMADPKAVNNMVAEAHRRFGRIDGLVNTVGGFRGGKPLHEADLSEWDFLYDINVRTALNACRAVIPYMLKSQSGRIINVASRNAFQGSPNYAAYSATKAMVLRMSESMAGELKARGINVNCIVPGTIDTLQNREAMPKADFSTWVPPGDLAKVIAFLLSDEARSVTGTAVPVYGRS